MAPRIQRSDITPILGALIDRLVAKAVVPEAGAVVVSCTEDVPHYTGEFDVLLMPGGEDGNVDSQHAHGRAGVWPTAELFVAVRSRLELDEAGRDRQRLMHASQGHLVR